jgi:hypothetical protein
MIRIALVFTVLLAIAYPVLIPHVIALGAIVLVAHMIVASAIDLWRATRACDHSNAYACAEALSEEAVW